MSVTLHTTKGDIKIELYCTQVPQPVSNFLALCASSAYTKTKFHRVIPGYIIQGGDPTGKGTVSCAAFGNGKKQKLRLPDEPHDHLTFSKRGVVAFANAGKPSQKGIGSQFFITLTKASHLDGTCTIIGHVIHGFDVVETIANVTKDGKEGDENEEWCWIENVTIHANPIANGDVDFQLPKVTD